MSDPAPAAAIPDRTKKEKPKKEKPAQKPKAAAGPSKGNVDTKGINVSKETDLPEWYQQVLSRGQFISYYDVSGCYILEPASYAIWQNIQNWFDAKIKTIGVRNCYYPLFISQANLEREKDHIEGFAAEVAWVTHGGKTPLENKIAVRPTSETAMYKDFADKVQSYRDLPLKRNQWCNVVRWEFSNPMPFIRSREFLWQEGHTAHATKAEADEEVLQILDFYAGVYEELLAVPVIKGQKTVNEQFPGAEYTTTVEAFIPATGRAIQAATSHCLGQHFAKMYDIQFEDPSKPGSKEKLYAWQNSWGLSTRSLGVLMLLHGDDKGAVIPPRVAEIQCILMPVGITAKTSEADKTAHYNRVKIMSETLHAAGIRAEVDVREHYTAGWKMSEYELRGVPVRIEFGPRDATAGVVTAVRRDDGSKTQVPIDGLADGIKKLLEEMQDTMFQKAKKAYDSHRITLTKWEDMIPTLNEKNVVRIPHCLDGDCADKVKAETAALAKTEKVDEKAPSMGAKALCIPFEQDALPEGTLCLRPSCGKVAPKWVQFGRSY